MSRPNPWSSWFPLFGSQKRIGLRSAVPRWRCREEHRCLVNYPAPTFWNGWACATRRSSRPPREVEEALSEGTGGGASYRPAPLLFRHGTSVSWLSAKTSDGRQADRAPIDLTTSVSSNNALAAPLPRSSRVARTAPLAARGLTPWSGAGVSNELLGRTAEGPLSPEHFAPASRPVRMSR